MFSVYHIIWLIIVAVFTVTGVILYRKYRPALKYILYAACTIAVLSELTKIFSVMKIVPSSDGSSFYPYIELNHLPLHFCSIQIIFIFYATLTHNDKARMDLLAFMCPTCLLGGLFASLIPSIYTTTITPGESFTSPVAYQFYIYHGMMILLGLIILESGAVKWRWVYLLHTLLIVYMLGFSSIYVNSMFTSPVYMNGELQSIEFSPNYFFTFRSPVNIPLTEKWQWCLYIAVMFAIVTVTLSLFYLIFIRKKIKANRK